MCTLPSLHSYFPICRRFTIMERYDTRISLQQKEVMVSFMEEHPEFATGKLLGVEGRKRKLALWEIVAEQLNACGGPPKTSIKWQRVWTDLKNKTKKKSADIQQGRRRTGGGPASKLQLSLVEQRIIAFLTEAAVYGLDGPDGVPLDSADDARGVVVPHPIAHNVLEDHNYQPSCSIGHSSTPWRAGPELLPDPESPRMVESPMMSPGSTSYCSTSEPTPTRKKRKRSNTGNQANQALEAVQQFAVIGTTSNTQMQEIGATMQKMSSSMQEISEKFDVLIKEKSRTNDLLQQLIDKL